MHTPSKTGLRHENARTEEQKRLMEKIERDGVCPFCAEHFSKYHPKPILHETEYWFVTTNMSPYAGTKHHFLFVYKPNHITHLREMLPEAQYDLFAQMSALVEEYQIPGGAFFMRFGDHRYTGGSVEHLHAHLIMGDADDPAHEPVRIKLG